MALLTLLIDADIIVHKLCVVSEQGRQQDVEEEMGNSGNG